MRVVRIATSNGIDDIKLIAENESETIFIKQLAEAGTLSSLNASASSTVLFRAISVEQSNQSLNNQLISKGTIGKYDMSVRQNENHNIGLTFIKNELPLDLTAYISIKLQVKNSKQSSAIISLELASGLTISGPDNNVLNIAFLANQTKELCNDSYYYDILFIGLASNVYYVEGKINVKKSTTR